MSAGFTADEEALYFKTGEAVLRRLRKTKSPGERLGVVREALSRFDDAYNSASAEARAQVACRSGCSACCHENVAVQAHEVLIVAEHIQRTFSPLELEAVIARAAAHRDAHAGRFQPGWTPPRTPCVLLRDDACSVYPARPESCRSHHSPDAMACRNNLHAGDDAVELMVHGVRGRMFAVMLAIDQAVEAEGYDPNAYDFGSALHEALTDSLCAIRWTQRKQAFPDSCFEA